MKRNKKTTRRKGCGCGCSTFVLLLIVFAVGVYVGKNRVSSFKDFGFIDLAEEYIGRAERAVKEKAGELFGDETLPDKEAASVEDGPVWEDGVTRLLYGDLSEDGKYAYRALFKAAREHSEKVFVPALDEEELRSVHAALKYDNPMLHCLSDEFAYGTFGVFSYVGLKYTCTKEECERIGAEMTAAAEELLAGAPGTGLYDDEVYIHDALLRASSYGDDGEGAHSAAGVLLEGKGVCSGYALATKLLFDMAGIESAIIRGNAKSDSGTEAHVWLVVRTETGWYHLDPTWDDPTGGEDTLLHTYFNVTTESIRRDHSGFGLPEGIECDSEDDRYLYREEGFCTQDNWERVVDTMLIDRLEDAPCEFELLFESDRLFDEAFPKLRDGLMNERIRSAVIARGLTVGSWTVLTDKNDAMNTAHYVIELH